MSILRSLTDGMGHLTDGARRSVARARLEAEHRTLQRRHAQALQELGQRVHELAGRGVVAEAPLSVELAQVREHEMLIAAKVAEIDALTFQETTEDA